MTKLKLVFLFKEEMKGYWERKLARLRKGID